MFELTGILLAGGKSRRLGRDKAQELVGGRRIIDRVLHSLRQVTKFQTVVVDRFDRIESDYCMFVTITVFPTKLYSLYDFFIFNFLLHNFYG